MQRDPYGMTRATVRLPQSFAPMMPFRIFQIFLSSALLSGCARFSSQPIVPEQSAAGLDARSLNSAELRAALQKEGSTSKSRWGLTQLAAAASVLNPDLAVLRAKVRTSEAALQTAGESPNPVFSIKPGYNTSSSGISPWIIEPGLDITIETGGKRDARQAAAAARVRTARLDYLGATWKSRGEVRRALLALHAAQATRGQYQSQEAALAEAAGLLESRVKDGAATPQDAAAARIPLGLTRVAKYDTELLAAKSRGQLATAVGVPVSALTGVAFDFSEVTILPVPSSGQAMRRRAITHRSDILAALSDYAASEESLRLEVAKQYPDVKLGPGYKLDQSENKWALGIGFELPLLHQHQGAIAEAEARREESAARFLAVQARAMGEIDVALAVYRAARSKAEAAGSLAEDVKSQTAAAAQLNAEGETSKLEVTQRRVEQGAADLARAQARLQAYESAGALEDALETPAAFWK